MAAVAIVLILGLAFCPRENHLSKSVADVNNEKFLEEIDLEASG